MFSTGEAEACDEETEAADHEGCRAFAPEVVVMKFFEINFLFYTRRSFIVSNLLLLNENLCRKMVHYRC
jgi:hypothetical protein